MVAVAFNLMPFRSFTILFGHWGFDEWIVYTSDRYFKANLSDLNKFVDSLRRIRNKMIHYFDKKIIYTRSQS